jgi:transposase
MRLARSEPQGALPRRGRDVRAGQARSVLHRDRRHRCPRARAGPILELFDAWVDRHRDHVDPRGPLDKAVGYYDNQRLALRRFLDDGRLRIDNNLCEGALRSLVLGRLNWRYFANETGLRWYSTFRSLIASCYLHHLEPQDYLEKVLRLAPHWPTRRVIELAPKHWNATLARLGPDERAILQPPWPSAGAPARLVDLDLPPSPDAPSVDSLADPILAAAAG